MGPARRILDKARTQFHRRRYARAAESAKQAGRVAALLRETRDASAKTLSHLAEERDRMASMGLATDVVDGILDQATALMHGFVERGGDEKFPAYEEAGQRALEGLDLARQRTRNFMDASGAIARVEQTLREFRDSNVNLSPESFDAVLAPAIATLREAHEALTADEYTRARERASLAAATVEKVRGEYWQTADALIGVDAAVRQLRAEGAPTEDMKIDLGHAQAFLMAGNLSEALRLISTLKRRLEEVQTVHRTLLLHLRTVQASISEAEQWGFNVRGAREMLREADVLLRSGRYEDARNRLDHARAAAAGVREMHRTVAGRIAHLRGPVSILRMKGGPTAIDADALFSRAEGLFDEGAYDDCAGTLDALDHLLERAGVQLPGVPNARSGTDPPSTDAR